MMLDSKKMDRFNLFYAGDWLNALNGTKVSPVLDTPTSCNRGATLSWQASPYLYPCSVQYYLIVASIICQMYRHIGAMTSPVSPANERLSDVVTSHEERASGSTAVDCDKVLKTDLLAILRTV